MPKLYTRRIQYIKRETRALFQYKTIFPCMRTVRWSRQRNCCINGVHTLLRWCLYIETETSQLSYVVMESAPDHGLSFVIHSSKRKADLHFLSTTKCCCPKPCCVWHPCVHLQQMEYLQYQICSFHESWTVRLGSWSCCFYACAPSGLLAILKMTWKRFQRYWPFCEGSHPLIPFTQGMRSLVLFFVLPWTNREQTVEMPAIWDVMTLTAMLTVDLISFSGTWYFVNH